MKKRSYITVLKLLVGRRWLRLPANIKGISNQFLKYRLPDEKLAQDIVIAFLVFAGLLWALGYAEEIMGAAQPQTGAPPKGQSGDRHSRAPGDRRSRFGRR